MMRVVFLLACLLSTGTWAQITCQNVGGMTNCYEGRPGSKWGGPVVNLPSFIVPQPNMPVRSNWPFMPPRQVMTTRAFMPAQPFLPTQPFMPIPFAHAQECYYGAYGSYLCM